MYAGQGSNLQPLAPEANTLSIELPAHATRTNLSYNIILTQVWQADTKPTLISTVVNFIGAKACKCSRNYRYLRGESWCWNCCL